MAHTTDEIVLLVETYHSRIELISQPHSAVAVRKKAQRLNNKTTTQWRNEVHILKMVLGQDHMSQILDCEETDLSITLRYEDGRSLDSFVREETRMTTLSAEDAVLLWSHMSGALSFLHGQSIVHDDVKPENIMWNSERSMAVLIDFGAAIHHPDGQPAPFVPSGTPPYAPPEFLQRRKGAEGDVWALGVTLLFAKGLIKLPDGEWILPHALEGEGEARGEMMAWLEEIETWREKLRHGEPLLGSMLEADPLQRVTSLKLVEELGL